MEKLTVKTSKKEEFIDITSLLQTLIKKSGIKNGICHVYIPHTTCGLTINEHADPSVKADIISKLGEMAPESGNYRHMEGNSPAHIKASITGSNTSIFVENGVLCLGTWQGIFLCEFDGPRTREVWVKILC
ncbi:MAG: YjbQ family protein [Elusimicrobia bacterium]|nr:YjbQ family protein [Elusimicrobiota bacterium]